MSSESLILNTEEVEEFITVDIHGQAFGLPILEVQDVFKPEDVTPVPLSIEEVNGVTNLRGKIVTLIDMHRRLDLPAQEDKSKRMCVGIEYKGESYGLIIDQVGEVLRLNKMSIEKNPANLDPRWKELSAGVVRLEKELMVVLDVNKVLDIGAVEYAVA